MDGTVFVYLCEWEFGESRSDKKREQSRITWNVHAIPTCVHLRVQHNNNNILMFGYWNPDLGEVNCAEKFSAPHRNYKSMVMTSHFESHLPYFN